MSNAIEIYTCPMHREVKQMSPGRCPRCTMQLVREDTRFALLRHVISSPVHVIGMLVVMGVVMAGLMMWLR